MAAKRHETVDANYEIVVLGLTNVANGFGSGFPITSSQSRTAVATALGARTQLAPLAGAGAVALFLIAWPGAFRLLPTATLAAVVICAALRMVQFRSVIALARVRTSEFVLSMVSFVAVAAVGVLWGIAVAIGLSVLNVVRNAWRPHSSELVRVDGLKGYHDANRHPEGQRIPGLVLFRFDAPLFFANAAGFRTSLMALLRSDTTRVVVTAEPMTDIDATAVEMLTDLHRELAERHIVLAFAEMKGHLRERMARAGLVNAIGPGRFAPTVGEAVRSHLVEHDIEWVDWEDRVVPTREDQGSA
jgi:MFS superfamily sulfate permease-like transporter